MNNSSINKKFYFLFIIYFLGTTFFLLSAGNCRLNRGMSPSSYVEYARSFLKERLFNGHAYLFSPQDDLEKIIAGMIYSEMRAIYIAAFNFTNKVILDALIDAMHRGVKVTMVVDSSAIESPYQRVNQLLDASANLYCFEDPSYDIMHNKFFTFDKNLLCGLRQIVWHGSANPTRNGMKRNYEAVHVTTSPRAWQIFKEQFSCILKDRRVRRLEKGIYNLMKVRGVFSKKSSIFLKTATHFLLARRT